MRSLNYYKKISKVAVFYDYSHDYDKQKSLFESGLSKTQLFSRVFLLICALPLSLLSWMLLYVLSIRYKVSIYVLKSFRPGWGSTYLNMMEPLCRQLQLENNARHIKILVDPGASVSKILVKSYEPHFSMYLDDRHKFTRMIAYFIPKSGLEKVFLNTSNKFLPSWLYQQSKNYANLEKRVPADLDEMGIKKDNFVLFSHASKNYYEARLSTTNFAQNSYRHYDLSSYEPAITKLIESNFKVIRVGVQVDELPNALKALPIIDYTGQVRTEIGELWLYENCKFLLSATSGAYWFARRFDRPTLLTNSYALPLGYFSTLYTPMTFRNVDTGKLLSLVDMFDLRKNSDYIESHFMRVNRLELVPNSASTILNSVNDVLDLSNEEIKKTSENLGLIKRYESILISFNVPIVEKMTMPALSFLKEYSYLLE